MSGDAQVVKRTPPVPLGTALTPKPSPASRSTGVRSVTTVERFVQLRQARDLMDRHFAEPLDLRELARAAGYSRFHFARSFRDAFGETPGAYLTRRRIERAKNLLRTANLTVTDVCFLVGFSSLGSFSTRFRELVGCSPSKYRERQVAIDGPPPVPGCFLMAWARPRPASAESATSEKREPPPGP